MTKVLVIGGGIGSTRIAALRSALAFISVQVIETEKRDILLTGHNQHDFHIDKYENYIKPVMIPNKQSWQAMNKGNFNKRQRRSNAK